MTLIFNTFFCCTFFSLPDTVFLKTTWHHATARRAPGCVIHAWCAIMPGCSHRMILTVDLLYFTNIDLDSYDLSLTHCEEGTWKWKELYFPFKFCFSVHVCFPVTTLPRCKLFTCDRRCGGIRLLIMNTSHTFRHIRIKRDMSWTIKIWHVDNTLKSVQYNKVVLYKSSLSAFINCQYSVWY